MAGLQPELWVDRAGEAVAFYIAAFDATVLHQVGDGDEVVAQLSVDGAAFWVGSADAAMGRLSPHQADGTTGRTLLVIDDPAAVIRAAVTAGARELAAVADEHGWRLGRIVDPFGHEWEIGHPLGRWPPD